jgi:DNA topoisomerase-1
MTNLIIVESPAKARTIEKYLGPSYKVKASVGHVKDLPRKRLGVDVENGFTPSYVTIRGKKKVIQEIKKASRSAESIYLAPDPDREGEAIAWHIAEEIRSVNENVYRVLFNEITKKGVSRGLAAPHKLDQQKFESQQTRRILDRLVGYQISPLLWKKVKRGLSAGRVQSVAVRLVVERERERQQFQAREYWILSCVLATQREELFEAKLHKIEGKKAQVPDEKTAKALQTELESGRYSVAAVNRSKKTRRPQPPFITARLQQEAARRFRFPPKRTMGLAQRLYEGVDLGGTEGAEGLITYMRTDSTRIADDALSEVRTHISKRYGAEYLPPKPIRYKSRKGAQDAHEAIRPTAVFRDPEWVRRKLVEPLEPPPGSGGSGGGGRKLKKELRERRDLAKLYGLIWRRFVASQMKPAVYDQTVVDIACGRLTLRAQGSILRFPGYTAVYEESKDEDANGNGNGTDSKSAISAPYAKQKTDAGAGAASTESRLSSPTKGEGGRNTLPELQKEDPLAHRKTNAEQKFTQPPPRFTEATLVRELEERGIGRPSTYAAILSTIQDRDYVAKERGRFYPTELGTLVTDLLVESFPDILNAEFTAKMEDQLDRIEEGKENWQQTLRDFYEPFKKDLAQAAKEMRNVKQQAIATDLTCEKCGAQMVIRFGRNGEFLACSEWPECRNTKEFKRLADGTIKVKEPEKRDETCEKCGAQMVVRSGRYGEFLSCSRYPECKFTKPLTLGIKCPRENCDGELIQKRSRRGKVFFGCSAYGKTGCDFVTWDRPVDHPCPQCGFKVMVSKSSRRGDYLLCPNCKAKAPLPE